MEGERRGGVTGARSGRALMLPTKRLPPADGRRIMFLIAALVQAGTEPGPDWRRKGGRQIIVSQRHTLPWDPEVQLPRYGPGSSSQA